MGTSGNVWVGPGYFIYGNGNSDNGTDDTWGQLTNIQAYNIQVNGQPATGLGDNFNPSYAHWEPATLYNQGSTPNNTATAVWNNGPAGPNGVAPSYYFEEYCNSGARIDGAFILTSSQVPVPAYYPQVQGTLGSVYMSLDDVDENPGEGPTAIYAALEQDGNIFEGGVINGSVQYRSSWDNDWATMSSANSWDMWSGSTTSSVHPDFSATGDPIQFGVMIETHNSASVTGIADFRVNCSTSSTIWPVQPYEFIASYNQYHNLVTQTIGGAMQIAGASISTVSGTPVATLTASASDPDLQLSGLETGQPALSATIDWGDGTISTVTASLSPDGEIVSNGGGNFTITANHIFGTNATYNVVVNIEDSLGASATTTATFNGGLTLLSGGDLASEVVNGSVQTSTGTLSQARGELASTTVGTETLFAGGNANSGVSNVVDIYNSTTGQWSTATLSQAQRQLGGGDSGQ